MSRLYRVVALALLILGFCLPASNIVAQSSDMEAVKAANQAFYAALSARDIGAMEKVWSKNADVRQVGPRSKTFDIGWPAVKQNFERVFDFFTQLSVEEENPEIKIYGSIALVSGVEKAQRKTKTGESQTAASFGTNIFEKQNGRWLMIYHHFSPVLQ